jgi:hypothetical protein
VTICFFDRRPRSQLARPHLWAREAVKQGLRRYVLPLLGTLRSLGRTAAGTDHLPGGEARSGNFGGSEPEPH